MKNNSLYNNECLNNAEKLFYVVSRDGSRTYLTDKQAVSNWCFKEKIGNNWNDKDYLNHLVKYTNRDASIFFWYWQKEVYGKDCDPSISYIVYDRFDRVINSTTVRKWHDSFPYRHLQMSFIRRRSYFEPDFIFRKTPVPYTGLYGGWIYKRRSFKSVLAEHKRYDEDSKHVRIRNRFKTAGLGRFPNNWDDINTSLAKNRSRSWKDKKIKKQWMKHLS